jgi:hypothetical protein
MNNIENKTALWLLALCPIFYIYGLGAWDGASFVLLILGIVAFLQVFNRGNIFNVVPMELIVLVLLSIVNYWVTTSFTMPISQIQVFLCYLAFWFFINQKSIGSYLEIYKKIGIVVVAFFFIQFIVLKTTGRMLSGIIPGLPLSTSITDVGSEWIKFHLASGECTSLFTEPAHLGRFLIPLIVIELFRANKIDWRFIALFSASVILSMSGTGIIVISALFVYWYFTLIDFKHSKNIVKFLGVGLLFGVLVYVIVGSEIGAQLLERKSELNVDYEGGSRSGLFRIYRGFVIFAEYDFNLKLFGTSNIDTIFSFEKRGIFGSLFGERVYFNGISTLLLYQGYIGLLIFCLLIIKIWKKASYTARAIIVCYIAYMFCESVYPGERLASYLVIACCLTKTNVRKICLK